MQIGIITSLIFFVVYGLMCTVGSFLVGWSETTVFKSFMDFMLTNPINWDKLITESAIYLLVHIIFWSLLVYLLTWAIQAILKKTGKT